MNRKHLPAFAAALGLAVGLSQAGLAAAQSIATLHSPAIASRVVLSSDATTAVAICQDGKARVWRLPAPEPAAIIDLHSMQTGWMELSKDGAWLATGTRDGTYTLWNARTGEHVWQKSTGIYPAGFAFDPSGKVLAVAATNQPVTLFAVASGKQILTLDAVQGGTQALAFSPDGTRLATADSDTAVRIYDSTTGKRLGRYSEFLMEPLAVAFSSDGRTVLAGGGDQVLVLLDSATAQPVRKSARLPDPVRIIQVRPGGTEAMIFLMHAADLSVHVPAHLLEISSGREVREWTPAKGMMPVGFAPDGHLLLVSATPTGLDISRAW